MMQCSSCGAPNKDEAKFCEECGKPLVPGSDEEQIDRLVDYLVANWFDATTPDANERRRLVEAAREVHAKWRANPRLEEAAVKIDEPTIDVDESFDAEELADIFSGRDAAARAEELREEEEARAEAERERENSKAAKRKEKAKENRNFWIGLAVGVPIVVGVGIIASKEDHKKEHDEKASSDKNEAHRGARTPAEIATPATTSTVPPVEVPVPIASCTCVSRANGKNTFALERLPSGGPWYMKWDQVSGFTSMKNGFWLGESDAAGAMTAISRDTTQLHAVMACENEIVAVVQGDVASAWSGTDGGELLWTRKLPAPYAFPQDAGIAADVACAPAVGVTGNVFTIPLAKGKSIALSIRDGSVQK